MALSAYRYLHYDVFTTDRFAGNQLAIFPEAAGLPAPTMQTIAREIGFAETTFVTAASDGADVRMRIFTPGSELPMAGHPVIGSTFALARWGAIPAGRAEWVFGLNVGATPVMLQWSGAQLTFAWMTQGQPEFGRVFTDLDAVASALGLRAQDIAATGLPVQQVSCGVPFVFVPVASREAVDRAKPDVHLLDFEAYVFTTEPGSADRAHTYSRMFAPQFGIPEDAATGGASGPLGCYLLRHRVVARDTARALINLQGVKMGRPSWIHISIESGDRGISRVRVGGSSVFVAEGAMDVEV